MYWENLWFDFWSSNNQQLVIYRYYMLNITAGTL